MKIIAFDDHTIKNTPDHIGDDIFTIDSQLYCLENLDNDDISNVQYIRRELKKKFHSYKSQDKKNSKYDVDQHITFDELVKKLKESKLMCYYCEQQVCLVYKKKGEPTQWSLERLNNNLGHYNDNTCISCLKCNLQRRTGNYEYFKYSKNLKIVKF